jgi:hypothetical protein
MIIIHHLPWVEELLVEIAYHLDPDNPVESDIPSEEIKRYIRNLILSAVGKVVPDSEFINEEHLMRVISDSSTSVLKGLIVCDVEMIDVEGSFVLFIED